MSKTAPSGAAALPPATGAHVVEVDTRPDNPLVRLVPAKVRKFLSSLPGANLALVPPKVAGVATNLWIRSIRYPLHPELPTPRLTVRFVGLVALDELVLSVFKSPSRLPSGGEVERVGRELRAAHRHYEARGWLDNPRAYHRTPPVPAMKILRKRSRGVAYEHLTWESTYQPSEGEPGRERWLDKTSNRTGHAYVLRHPEPDRPWVMCVHGLGTGIPIADFTCFRVDELHRELGYNVILPVLPLHGPRRMQRRIDEFMTYDLVDTIHAVAHGIWDLRTALGWVRLQGGTQVGLHGVSLGGFMSSILATLDGGLDFVMAGVPVVDVPELYAFHAPPGLRRKGREEGLLGPLTHDVHRVISPLTLRPLVPVDRRAVYGALGDRMSTAAQAHRLWMHWEQPHHRWFTGNHTTFLLDPDAREFVRERFEDWLGVHGPEGREERLATA